METGKCYDVKITILKKLKTEDIHKKYAKSNIPVICAKGKERKNTYQKNVICHKVFALGLGNDSFHPVIYKLERVEE